MPQRITIKDIARLAGVSRSTVSRALIEPPVDINPETRARILEICRREGYQANSLARSLVSHQTHVLGLITPNITNPYYSELALALELYARQQGYNVMLCNSLHDDALTESLLDFFAGRQVDGVILAGSARAARNWLARRSEMFPAVLLGVPVHDEDDLDEEPVTSVSADNVAGARMGVQHLASLGHRDILYFGLRPASPAHQQRARGYLAAMRALGLTPRVLENPQNACSIEFGYELAKRLFTRGCSATAIFAVSDAMTLGVVRAADECGVRIPEDISLLGYDNIADSILPDLSLSTIDVHKQEQAAAAVDLLLQMAARRSFAESTQRLIRPTLLARTSTAPPSKRA